jgi:type II secretory pathway pseudopilin PulG
MLRRGGKCFAGATRAFTLIETMISLVVIFLAILAMLAVVPFAFTNVQTNSLEVQAVAVGQQFLDDERNASLLQIPLPSATTIPIDGGQSFSGDGVNDVGYGNFSVTPDGCTTKELTGSVLLSGVDTYLCSATVSWTESKMTRSVTVQSYVTK